MRPIPKARFLAIVVAMLSGLGITPGWASPGERAGFAKIGPLNMYYEVHGGESRCCFYTVVAQR